MGPGIGEEIGRALREARRRRGLTLRQAAAASGHRFRPTSIASYERGERRISLDRFCDLCDVYGLPADHVLREILSSSGRAIAARPAPDEEVAVRIHDLEVIGRGPGDDPRSSRGSRSDTSDRA